VTKLLCEEGEGEDEAVRGRRGRMMTRWREGGRKRMGTLGRVSV
jgi:hypothetical protein